MRIAVASLTLLLGLSAAAPAGAARTSVEQTLETSDGVVLHATLSGEAPLAPRPTVVEFTPYGVDTGTIDPGPNLNRLVVEDRGTGRSDGGFDALGPLAQRDVKETLEWACRQPWSSGTLGLNGFSASAIVVYNALHLELPCVKAAVLKSGTFELYRDLLYPGGVSNIAPGFVVITAIGAGALAQAGRRDLGTSLAAFQGTFNSGTNVLAHPTLDGWWRERGFRGNTNRFPILMVGGFFDVESRGAFEAYKALRDVGSHLYVVGGHDQAPRGTDGGRRETTDWFEHYLRGAANGVEKRPRVQLWMSRGDRRTYVAGDYVKHTATDWPPPGTRWDMYFLSPQRSGTARSLNDGTLAPAGPATRSTHSYPAATSNPQQTDVPNAATIDAGGPSAVSNGLPAGTDMSAAEALGLSWTSAPIDADFLSAGPIRLSIRVASTAPTTTIWAVLSDVSPDGTPHPLTAGRLSTDFPGVIRRLSPKDPRNGIVVQPYADFSTRSRAVPGGSRMYHLELWPIGNQFRTGHRIRLHVVSQSAASLPTLAGLNTVTLGGVEPSRLLIPVTPLTPPCRPLRTITVRLRARYRGTMRSGTLRIGGRTVARLTKGRRRVRIRVPAKYRSRVQVTTVLRLRNGRRVVYSTIYRTCLPGQSGRPRP